MAVKVARKKVNKVESPNRPLEQQARENTRATLTKSRETTVVKEGVPLDHSPKHNIEKETAKRTVGINIGLTKNMGDFESLRIDCWLSDVVNEGETHTQAFERISQIAQAQLEKQVEELAE